MISSSVARRHAGSTLINSMLVRVIAVRKAVLVSMIEWRKRSAWRRELMDLTDSDLRDIGVTRKEAKKRQRQASHSGSPDRPGIARTATHRRLDKARDGFWPSEAAPRPCALELSYM